MEHAIEIIRELCDSSKIDVDPFLSTHPTVSSPFDSLQSAWSHADWDILVAGVQALQEPAYAECCYECVADGIRTCPHPPTEHAPRLPYRRPSNKAKRAIATLVNKCLPPQKDPSDRIGVPKVTGVPDSMRMYARADGRVGVRHRNI
jgi:hypothetical protein